MASTPTNNAPSSSVLKSEYVLTNGHHAADSDRHLSNHDILALQIRAFLEASEDVDIDPETVEDLLQSMPEQLDTELDTTNDNQEDRDDEDDANVEIEAEELDISPLYGSEEEAEQSWTKQETKQILHHLKERGMSSFVKEYVLTRNISIPKLLRAFGVHLCPQLQNKRASTMLYFLKVAMSHQLRMRDKLPQYNTISDAVQLIKNSRNILILTGAGISVSCGIPDFRSKDGLYASLKDKGDYDLDDPQQMFDINYFKENPSVFYSFASQIYPSNFVPSPCHRFIKVVEEKGKLLRNYTQNIDTLETLAGVQRVLQCHGSFATASCLLCRRRVPGKEIEADILRQKVPLCSVCNTQASAPPPVKGKKKSKKKARGEWDSEDEDQSDGPIYPPGIMKPDITFFGEKLTDEFDESLAADRDKVDLLLVIGTSLKVSPVAEILSHLPHSIPQILINKTPIRHINPDIVLLGNADDIVEYICDELGWELPAPVAPPEPTSTRLYPQRGNLKKRPSSDARGLKTPERVGDSHVWLFDGAEGGRWLEEFKKTIPISEPGTPTLFNSGNSTRSSTPGGYSTIENEERRESKKMRIG